MLNKRWQQGLSLIEAAMVLALSAVVVAGVMAYYQSASTNEKTERTISEVMSLLSAINGTYSSAPNFEGISEKIIAKTGALPSSYISSDGGITTPNGAKVTIKPGKLTNGNDKDDGDPNYFQIDFGVPRSMCSTMARLDLGSSLVNMKIGDRGVVQSKPLSVEESQEMCGDAKGGKGVEDQVTMYYGFH